MSEKPGVMMYWETFDVLDVLLDGQAKTMLRAVRQYAQNGISPNFKDDTVLTTLWILLKSKIDADAQRFQNVIEKRSRAGKASAEKRRQKGKSNQNEHVLTCVDKFNTCQQIQPSTSTSTTTTTTTNNYIGDESPIQTKFFPPTVDEVRAYCHEKGYHIDPSYFVDYYAANGWMRGKTKIKDWKACVRTWVKNGNKTGTADPASDINEGFELVDNGNGVLVWQEKR